MGQPLAFRSCCLAENSLHRLLLRRAEPTTTRGFLLLAVAVGDPADLQGSTEVLVVVVHAEVVMGGDRPRLRIPGGHGLCPGPGRARPLHQRGEEDIVLALRHTRAAGRRRLLDVAVVGDTMVIMIDAAVPVATVTVVEEAEAGQGTEEVIVDGTHDDKNHSSRSSMDDTLLSSPDCLHPRPPCMTACLTGF